MPSPDACAEVPGNVTDAGPSPVLDTTDFDDYCTFAREAIQGAQRLELDDLDEQREAKARALRWARHWIAQAEAKLEAER